MTRICSRPALILWTVKINTMHEYPNLMAVDKETRAKIFKAVDSLCVENPGIAEQLQRLADIKTLNPKQWEAGKKFLKL